MDPFKKDGAVKRKEILDALEKYPCSFKLKDIDNVKKKAFEGLRNHLEAGLEAGYKTSLQTASTRNLLAFVLFQLEERDKALEETDEVLKMDDQQNNIVSLANKVYMLSMMISFDEADEALDELKELQETPEINYLLVKAKAELAASYLRFGPRFNKYAIDAFKEVLPQAKEPEVWMWKFGLAVAYRHALDLQHAPYVSHGQYTVTHRDALKLLQEITDSKPRPGEEEAHINLQANAYADMGILLRLTWNKTTEYQLCSQAQSGSLACCKKALQLDDNDASVLWKSGKLYRNYRDIFKSRKLLEKAVQQQPSSAAYHHLGLTYKAMATNLQHGKLKTRRGGRRQKQRRKGREERMKSQRAESEEALQCDLSPGPSVPVSGKQRREHEQMERIKRVVKSPPQNTTQFESTEDNTQKAIENLKMAVDFSAGENSRAVYDLALLYRATNDFDRALNKFSSIVRRRNGEISTPAGLLEQITSLEQMGLINKEKADREMNEMKRKALEKDSESNLNGALSLAARLYSDVRVVKDIFGEIFHSPSALLKAADASDQTDRDKHMIKAKICSLINNNKQAQDLLTKIAEKERDADYTKLQIEICSKSGEHEKAAALMSCLKATEQYPKVIKLFESQRDVHFLFDIYFNAGKKVLVDGPCDDGYFVDAFRQEVKVPALQPIQSASSPPDDDPTSLVGATAMNSSSKEPEDSWDIMLLHDEEDDDIEGKADRLHNLLETACGLRVVRRDGNQLPGSRVRTVILKNIENSRLVVILPGKEQRLPEFEEFVSIAATKEFAVLLTGDIGPEAIPWELNTPRLRCMKCPEDLFVYDIAASPYPEQFVNSVCRLFKFLVNRE